MSDLPAKVYHTKRTVSVGQGRWAVVYSCYCAYALLAEPPPGKRLLPLTAEVWDQKITELCSTDHL
jgi:hypothetical protein